MTNKHAIHKQFTTHYSQLTKFAVLDYSGAHSLNAHTNCISNFNIRNRLSALTSFARQSLASLLSQNNSLNCFVRQSRKSAFTLAETLIVMGIIGVVAALTLPNLNSSTGDKEKVAKVKKIYSNLNDALGRAQAVYGPIDEWCSNLFSDSYDGFADCQQRKSERLTEFLKLSKNCGMNGSKNCLGRSSVILKLIDGEDDTDEFCNNDTVCVILEDGTLLEFNYNFMVIDIDGPNKGPFTYGKDIFSFKIDNTNELTAYGNTTNCFKYGLCTNWVIMNDNMEYLKANSTGKCNNSNVTLNETVTSCK